MSWLKDPQFSPLVQEIWDKPCSAETAFDRIQMKLKRVKQFFKGWGFNRQGEQRKLKRSLQDELLIPNREKNGYPEEDSGDPWGGRIILVQENSVYLAPKRG